MSTRLPGDDDTTDRHQQEERAETRLSGDLAHRFSEYVEAHGAQKSEVLRQALDEFLPASENSAYVLPRDPELADAYLTLAKGEKRVLSVDDAETILCNESHPNTPKDLIKDDVLKPLEESGLLGVANGRVAVHPLTLRDDAGNLTDD
jgi:hypothetical protein